MRSIRDVLNDPVRYSGRSYTFEGSCSETSSTGRKTYSAGCETNEGMPAPNYKIINGDRCIYYTSSAVPDCSKNYEITAAVHLTQNNIPWLEQIS